MKRFITILLLVLSIGSAEGVDIVLAAKRLARPVIGAPVGEAVTGGFAVDIKDCYVSSPYTASADTEASSGTMVSKASTGRYDEGQIGCPVNVSANTYYVWVKARLRGVTQVPERVFWFDTAPFKSSFQNAKGTLISQQVDLPPSTSFDWIAVGSALNMATLTQGTVQATFSLGSGSVVFFTAHAVIEFDCLFFATSDSATPICPAGAPATGIAHNATGTAASGSAVSSLAPTITVASGDNRAMFAGVCHRTNTNTISGVSSNVNGAFTLVNWSNNDTVAGALYRLIAPTVGAHTVTVSFSAAQNAAAGLVAYSGISQTSPNGTVLTNTGNGDPSLNVSGATDQLAVDHLCISVDNAETVTVNASQTQRWQKEVDIAGGANRISVWSDKQGDSSVTMSSAISGTKAWSHQSMMIHPPSVAGAPPVLGTPSVTLLGPTSARVEASVDDPSASCEAEYDTNTGAPYANNTTDVGATGGKCIVQITGLSASTAYFYRINATNGQGTTNGSEGTFNTTAASAVTALGITQAEIDIWNTRRVSGPYKSTGDVSANSPGDWLRIQSNADAFVGNPSAEVWAGYTGSGCYNNNSGTAPQLPGRQRGEKIRDAGFVYLVTGNTAYRDAVLTRLLAQAATAGTQFDDGAKWISSVGCTKGDSHVHEIGNWLAKIVFAYDYIRHGIGAGDRTTLDAWFLAAGVFWDDVTAKSIETRFTKRDSDDYTVNSSFLPDGDDGMSTRLTHYGGYTARGFMEAWANRSGTLVRFVGLAGLLNNNTALKNRAKRWFQEWVKYHLWPDSTANDFRRWLDTVPTLGWHYSGTGIGSMSSLADFFARAGDTSLYDYTTTDGLFGTSDSATAKSLQKAILIYTRMVNATVSRYGTASAGNNGNPAYLIGPNDGVATTHRKVHDTYSAQANIYYQNTEIKSYYTRQASGSPIYPVTPTNSGEGSSWGGDWNTLPGVLFMFGQMEGVVSPYP